MPGSRERRITPIRGASENAGRLPAIASDPEKGFVFDATGVRVHCLGTQSIKDYLFQTLPFPSPAPQSWEFSAALDKSFYPGLLAEHLVETASGRKVWRSKNKNKETGEPLDCVVYAYAAEMMERKWTKFGDTLEREIAISRQSVEASIEAAVESVLAARAPLTLTAKPADEPAQPETETPAEPPKKVEKRDSPFEFIWDGDDPDEAFDPAPAPRQAGGFQVIGRN